MSECEEKEENRIQVYPAPGRLIENILMERISVLSGQGEEMSVICGYDEERRVKNVRISEFYRDGRRVKSLSEANIRVGEYADGVELV